MKETTMSFRMQKLRSNNFIKNFNHSNRKKFNSNHYQLGKHIDKKRIKENVFLVDNPIIDNCSDISEVWKLFEEDYKLYGNDYTTKKINKKVKVFKNDGSYEFQKDDNGKFVTELQESKCKVPFIRKTQNVRNNVNGKMVSKQVETSIISEFVFQIGGLENDIRDKLNKEDFVKIYQLAVDTIHEETKGSILKAVIHFDESYPHLHLFFTPYNLEKHQVQNSWTSTPNNVSILQDKLHVVMKNYLLENYQIHLKNLEKKVDTHKEHMPVKEFKKSKNMNRTSYNKTIKVEPQNNISKLKTATQSGKSSLLQQVADIKSLLDNFEDRDTTPYPKPKR